MDFEATKNQLLQKIEKATGLSIDIKDSSLSDDETLIRLRQLLAHYSSLDSRASFLKSFLSDELSSDEITQGIHRYHIEENIPRALFLLESQHPYSDEIPSLIKSLLPGSSDDVICIDDTHITVIITYSSIPEKDDLLQYANELLDMLETEAFTSFKVAYDEPISSFTKLNKGYQDIVLAMHIGNIFFSRERIYHFSELGLSRLLFNVPKDECVSYLKNQVNLEAISSIDEETLITLQAFFDNDLSIAETSRQQFIHRNTLIYRLDKFKEQTGLDVRRFSDAITCKIALLLLDYINS